MGQRPCPCLAHIPQALTPGPSPKGRGEFSGSLSALIDRLEAYPTKFASLFLCVALSLRPPKGAGKGKAEASHRSLSLIAPAPASTVQPFPGDCSNGRWQFVATDTGPLDPPLPWNEETFVRLTEQLEAAS